MSQDKAFVFNRVELAILILFFLIASCTAFILGIRFGQKYYWVSETNPAKSSVIKTSSNQFEVDEINIQKASQLRGEKIETPQGEDLEKVDIDDATFKKLQIELAKLERSKESEVVTEKINHEIDMRKMTHTKESDLERELENSTMARLQAEEAEIDKQLEEVVAEAESAIEPSQLENIKNTIDNDIIRADKSLMGKFTIQLGSFKTYKEAKDFSENFIARNYKPIINEVDLGYRGTWFRVGLGLFDSEASARKYLDREAALFEDQETYINIIE